METKLSIKAVASELNQDFLDKLVAVFGNKKLKITIEKAEMNESENPINIAELQKLEIKEKLRKGLTEVNKIIKGETKGTSLDEFFNTLEEEQYAE